MEQQDRIQTVAPSQQEDEKGKKERVKATFSLLNHLVKIYNEGETYVKRGITLFGLGSIIAGISFGAGQQVSQKETEMLNSLNNASTSQVQSTPQPIINHTLPNGQPSVIYLAPVHGQHGFIPTHNPFPVTTSTTPTHLQRQPAPTSVSTSKTVPSSPVEPAPTSVSTPKSPNKVTSKPERETEVRKPAIFKQPQPQPTSQQKQNSVKQPSIFKQSQPKSVNTVLTDVEQTVEPLKQVSGILSGLKQTVEPWVNESE